MSFIDYIKNFLSRNKKNARFITEPFTKTFGDPEPLEVALYDGNNPITNEEIGIEINGKGYIKTTDENGIARLNINLGVGKYTAKCYWKGINGEYNSVTGYVEIIVKGNTYMEGTNVNKFEGDTTPYQCALYRSDNGERIKSLINIIINGKTYTREADNDNLYKLSLNLPEGTYNIKAVFNGTELFNPSTVENIITINKPVQPSTNKKTIVLGCDANTSEDKNVQNQIASRLEAEGYSVEKLPIGPNYFASYDYSSKSKGKIGIYLIASGIFSIADAYYGSGQFDNYVFGIRGDFGDKGATCFDCPIRADADCTSICDELNGKTFNQINSMLQPYVAVCGGGKTDELADNIINWLNALEHREERPPEPTPQPEPKSYSEEILEYFESKFGEMSCIDDCLEAIQGNGYGYYYDDAYTNYTSINRMANGSGVNCTDSCHVFWHLAVALGYRVEVLHIQCSGGDGHVRLELEREGTGTFYRDPAAVLDGEDITYNWCNNGYRIATNPDWFFENLYR